MRSVHNRQLILITPPSASRSTGRITTMVLLPGSTKTATFPGNLTFGS